MISASMLRGFCLHTDGFHKSHPSFYMGSRKQQEEEGEGSNSLSNKPLQHLSQSLCGVVANKTLCHHRVNPSPGSNLDLTQIDPMFTSLNWDHMFDPMPMHMFW